MLSVTIEKSRLDGGCWGDVRLSGRLTHYPDRTGLALRSTSQSVGWSPSVAGSETRSTAGSLRSTVGGWPQWAEELAASGGNNYRNYINRGRRTNLGWRVPSFRRVTITC